MMVTNREEARGGARRRARVARPGNRLPDAVFELSEADAAVREDHFGVARAQIEHDFVLSHVLAVLAPHADRFVFHGGTALSRTILEGLRLSEDIDLLSVGPRAEVAPVLDEAIRAGLQRGLGTVNATPWLSEARTDTAGCVFRIGGVYVRIQLLDGRLYPAWPTQASTVSQRYAGLPDVALTTYSAEGFAGAKTTAWCDTTRNAPRDLYDLWAMAQAGYLTADAARVYRRYGPTGGLPRRAVFPARAPSLDEWVLALGHQCIPKVGPDEAFETVVRSWEAAATAAEADDAR